MADKKIDDIVKKNNIFHLGKVTKINNYIIEASGLDDAFFFEKVISCETLNEVNRLEKALIDSFKSNEECNNKISGGGGCTSDSKEYYIYVALK